MRKLIALPLMAIGGILAIMLLTTLVGMALTLFSGLVVTMIVVGIFFAVIGLVAKMGEWANV